LGAHTLRLEPPKPEEVAPATTTPDAPAPSEPAKAGGLPDFAKKADDLDAIKKAVDDAAAVAGPLWLSYLFVVFYILVTTASVTDTDIFLENPIKLAILTVNLGVSLPGYFFLAPIVFLILHAYTLVYFVMLGEKSKWFNRVLHAQIPDATSEAVKNRAIRESLERQLASNIFVQLLAGPPELRRGPFGWLLQLIATVTLVVAPVLLLTLIQIRFLPYHSIVITWTQRLALVADLLLIWWLWRRLLSGREIETQRQIGLWGSIATACTVVFAWVIATFPGERQESLLAEWDKPSVLVSFHNWLFNGPIDASTRNRTSLFSSTLVLTGFNVYKALGIDPEKANSRDFVLHRRGRDLTGAIFDFAILPKVDFTGADLEGASFYGAQLQGASLEYAQLQGASLNNAGFQGTSLYYAQLQGAWLGEAQLQGASLYGAQLQGASLDSAQLKGASLGSARLQGASLKSAQLQGASLDRAQLQGASLDFAQLQGASLAGAQFQGASLEFAQLQGASLQQASLPASDLSQALLWRTNAAPGGFEARDVPGAVRLHDSTDQWQPAWSNERGERPPWNDKAYQDLTKAMDSIPPGNSRDEALDRIRKLDCANPDKMLASCDPSADPPPEAVAWRKALEAARVGDDAYRGTLANVLKDLVCSSGEDAIYVVRGISRPSLPIQDRLEAAGAAARGLIDDLMNKDSKDCPVAAALTDADRAKLLQIKQRIEAAPKPASDSMP
jgi:uncharacterized protein YjbI with pentapeptide repeats